MTSEQLKLDSAIQTITHALALHQELESQRTDIANVRLRYLARALTRHNLFPTITTVFYPDPKKVDPYIVDEQAKLLPIFEDPKSHKAVLITPTGRLKNVRVSAGNKSFYYWKGHQDVLEGDELIKFTGLALQEALNLLSSLNT